MENKVSNGMFRAFVSEKKPQAVANELWKKGGVANGHDVGDHDDLPVFRLTRAEAERFADWMGGRLPTARQLDLAAGCFGRREGRAGPAAPGPLVAVGRGQLGPRKITEFGDDVSPFDIHDLSGNGREWTHDDLILKDGKRLAVLRAKSYTAQEPLTFAELDDWINNEERRPVQHPEHRSWTIGFRVVIELSNQPDAK
jgi:formylglycine-generating enzyme required for sulfatase activity